MASTAPVIEPPAASSATVSASSAATASASASDRLPPLPTASSDTPRVVSRKGTRLPSGGFLAAPCVHPHVDIIARLRIPFDPSLDPGEIADLDGDGVGDWMIFIGASNITSRAAYYLRRGTCGHFVGLIETSANVGPTSERSGGLLEMSGSSRCQVDCCPNERQEFWTFNGSVYRLARTRPMPSCKPGTR